MMYDDWENFGWEYVKEEYMPDGIVPKHFAYLKAVKRIINGLIKEKTEEKQFEHQVHGKTRKDLSHISPDRHITYIRKVVLPEGAEDETFD